MVVEGRRPIGRPKKAWSKIVEDYIRKLNIKEVIAEDRKQCRQLILYHVQPEMKMMIIVTMLKLNCLFFYKIQNVTRSISDQKFFYTKISEQKKHHKIFF